MIYDNIKEIAQKRGLSIAALEHKANLGNGTIGRWRNSSPSVDSLLAVAKVLKVSISTLTAEK